jgi:hypothetical protein
MELESLLNWLENDKRIKIIKNSVQFQREYKIYDVSLTAKGSQEDVLFLQDKLLVENLRRGTSFLVSPGCIDWARKGLPKFFEVSLKDLAREGLDSQLSVIDASRINIRQGKLVNICQTIKANGENAQVSYKAVLGAWIIGSKNVCLAARDRNDLEFYSALRYNFAKLIGETWFNLIEPLSAEEVQKLKQKLETHTFVGEYTGNPNCQHIINYTKTTINFFAIVSHSSTFPCIRSLGAYEIFNNFHLPCISFNETGTFSTENALTSVLKTLYLEIENGSIETAQEGSVIYFNDNENCFGLCKIKNREYKILRKLRENAKSVCESPLTCDRHLKSFSEYLDKLQRKTGLDFGKYAEIAQKVFREVAADRSKISFVQNNFVSYISGDKKIPCLEPAADIPIFLGIEVSDLSVISIVCTALTKISNCEPNQIIQNDLNSLKGISSHFTPGKVIADPWRFPESLHIITLFIGKNSKVLHSPHYTSFVPGKVYQMEITHILYIPQKLLCGIIKFTDSEPLIATKIPYITLLLGKIQEKAIRNIIEKSILSDTCNEFKTKHGIIYSIPVFGVTFKGKSKGFIAKES